MNNRQRLSTPILTIVFAAAILISTVNAQCPTGLFQGNTGTVLSQILTCISQSFFVTDCSTYNPATYACTCAPGSSLINIYDSTRACTLDANFVPNC